MSFSRPDGVVVTKGRGYKPGKGDLFLTAIKIRGTSSFGWEVQGRRHIVRFYGMLKFPV